MRRREAESAAGVIGAASEVWEYPDGHLQVTLELRHRIIHQIRTFRPDLVLTHRPNDYHPDHRAVGQVAVDAVFPTARDPLNFREHLDQRLQPWKVAELFLWSTNEANQIVDIGDWIDRKIDALAHHASQFHDFGETAKWLRRRAEELGERTGYRAAEGFRRVMLAR